MMERIILKFFFLVGTYFCTFIYRINKFNFLLCRKKKGEKKQRLISYRHKIVQSQLFFLVNYIIVNMRFFFHSQECVLFTNIFFMYF